MYGTERDVNGALGYNTSNNEVNVDELRIEFPGTGETTNRQQLNSNKKIMLDLAGESNKQSVI